MSRGFVSTEFLLCEILLFSSIVGFLVMAMLYYIRNRREIIAKCGNYFERGQRTWLVWPAVGANAFFGFAFGKRIISVRSVITTLAISLGANLACIILILINFPEDFPPLEGAVIRVLSFSLLWFIVFNFVGDVVSLSITRYCVRKIASKEYDLVKYLSRDILGIGVGYVITVLPAVASASYAKLSFTPVNPWIQSGMLGSVLIPGILFIFATKGLPIVFGIFAVIAVFSITIPTAIYLSLMGLCLVGFKVNEWWLVGRDKSRVEMLLQLTQSVCFKILIPLVTAAIALMGLYKLRGTF